MTMLGGTLVFLSSLALLVAVPALGFAQASSVSLATPAPTPTGPLEISDSDYPLESLIAHDEGQTVLNLVLADTGAVRLAQIIGSSGSPALDGTAARIARARWSFQPQSGTTEVRATVAWRLPLSTHDDYAMDAFGPPATSEFIPPASKPGNVPRVEEDYPDVSIRLLEQGEVILKSWIDESGKILDVSILETSGFPRLDQSALNFVRRRFAYEPASVDGRPAAVTFTTYVSFELGSSRSVSRQLFCHNRPVFSTHDRHIPQRSGRPARFSEWLLTSDGSRIDDALLRTKRGWLQVAPTALVQMKLPPNYRVVRRANQQQCWVHFDGDIPP